MGIIPAFAGNTQQAFLLCVVGWDHPRIRGEHHKGIREVLDELGSSPHSRGTRGALAILQILSGIIPAFAGNTNTEARDLTR